MTKKNVVEFDAQLHKLFSDRTHWLRTQVRKPKPGKAPGFNKKKVEASISKLQVLATKCLLHSHAVDGLRNLYDTKKQWHVKGKGWGSEKKRITFMDWFEKTIPYKNCVYVFWAKRQCRYVGRTLNGKGRPQSHFHKDWFAGITRIDIYAAKVSRQISKLECLATHRFCPTKSKIKPSAAKWHAKCPICETHRAIRSEIKSIFRLK